MSAVLLSGKELARTIREKAHQEARDLEADGLRPTLAVVVATDDGSTHWYVRSIERAAGSAGIDCRIVDLGPDADGQTLASVCRTSARIHPFTASSSRRPCLPAWKRTNWWGTSPRRRTSMVRTP
jgi:hypothetical protein